MRQILGLLLASFLLTCTAVRSAQNVTQTTKTDSGVEEQQVRVTLNIFSGRKNPTWLLPKEQADDLASIIKELPTVNLTRSFDGLGYRGFRVTFPSAMLGKPTEITVYKGKVRYSDGCGVKYLADRDRRIERLLLKSSNSHVDAEVYKTVAREIERPGE
jgi:hypothetical protein